jgi:hypothetical protein
VKGHTVTISITPQVNNIRVWVSPLPDEELRPTKKFSLKDPRWAEVYSAAGKILSHTPEKLSQKLDKLEFRGKFFIILLDQNKNTNKRTETKGVFGDLFAFPCWWVHQGRSGIPGFTPQAFLFFHIWDGKEGQNPMQDNILLTPWGASALMDPMEGYTMRKSWIEFTPKLYCYLDPSFEELDKQLFKTTEEHKCSGQQQKTKKKKTRR